MVEDAATAKFAPFEKLEPAKESRYGLNRLTFRLWPAQENKHYLSFHFLMLLPQGGEDGWGPLTEEVDDEASIGEATGGSAEEGTAVGGIDGVAESGDESTRVRVGVAEVEDVEGRRWTKVAID